jgi:hypothetical protein
MFEVAGAQKGPSRSSQRTLHNGPFLVLPDLAFPHFAASRGSGAVNVTGGHASGGWRVVSGELVNSNERGAELMTPPLHRPTFAYHSPSIQNPKIENPKSQQHSHKAAWMVACVPFCSRPTRRSGLSTASVFDFPFSRPKRVPSPLVKSQELSLAGVAGVQCLARAMTFCRRPRRALGGRRQHCRGGGAEHRIGRSGSQFRLDVRDNAASVTETRIGHAH